MQPSVLSPEYRAQLKSTSRVPFFRNPAGSILDVQLRPDVSWAVASAGWVFVLTLGIQIFGTYAWYTRGQCTPFEPTTSISSRAMFLVILYGHWATIAGEHRFYPRACQMSATCAKYVAIVSALAA